MKIRSAEITLLELPFRLPVSHATKHRLACDSVLVRVESDRGVVGWGEGVPRSYVSGETAGSVVGEIESVIWPAIADAELPDYQHDLGDYLSTLGSSLPETPGGGSIVAHHAARCAVELALLDCALREAGVALGDALGQVRESVRYSGMLPTGNLETAKMVLGAMRSQGIEAVKVKVGDEGDQGRLDLCRSVMGEAVSMLADANGVWTVEEAIAAGPMLAAANLQLIEQPLPRGPASDLASVRAAIQTPVMVDESLVSLQDAAELIEARACDIFNIRISKCGGLGRSLRFIELARQAGLKWQLGAHVGETALLSAVGRAVALAHDDPIFVEGSIGEWLLVEDLSSPSVQFGAGGVAGALAGPGLGVEVIEERVRKYAVDTRRLGG